LLAEYFQAQSGQQTRKGRGQNLRSPEHCNLNRIIGYSSAHCQKTLEVQENVANKRLLYHTTNFTLCNVLTETTHVVIKVVGLHSSYN